MVAAPGMMIADARRALSGALRRAQFETPDLDARILIGHALNLDHTALITQAGRALSVPEAEAIAAVAARRLACEPVARIVGFKEFWSLPFSVNGTTLVPRPETETVVEAALAAIIADKRQRSMRLLDIGTGSGALILALLSELPDAMGVATDINPATLAVAHQNAKRLGLTERVCFVACDMTAALYGAFDLIVSNPPYVVHGKIAALAPGVRDYEPHIALDGGPDGLDAYRTLAAQAPRLLDTSGMMVVELGAGQDEAVGKIFEACGLAVAALRSDLNGIPRALTAVHA
jgi:release factor glutamine methyltransferase